MDDRSLRDALDRGEHEAEVMFGQLSFEAQERERLKLAQEWGDRILLLAIVALAALMVAEAVLRLGLGVSTIL